MDIMNNMNVSSSKFRFSLLAITALLVIGTGMGANQAFAAAPTFVAIHNSTTTTEIIFSEGVNGTARFIDWHINGVNATAITNGTAPSAKQLASSAAVMGGNNAVGSGEETFGFFNRTLNIMLTHHTLNSGDTLVVNYTGNNKNTAGDGNLRSSPLIAANDSFDAMAYYTGSAATETEATALDQMPPTAVSAQMINAKSVRITMSENIGNFNTTAQDFQLHGANTGGINFSTIVANNGTNGKAGQAATGPADGKIIYLTTDKPMTYLMNYLTISYGAQGAFYNIDDQLTAAQLTLQRVSQPHFLSDDTNSYKNGCRVSCDTPHVLADQTVNGIGNRLANFTGLAFDNILLSNGQSASIITDKAPEVTSASIQVNNGFIEALVDTAPVNVDVEVGDTVNFDFTITDDNGQYTIPSVSLYTNFIDRPDDMNLFYTNNFDTVSQESTSYYEWNVRSDDIAYDYSNTVSWNPATYKVVDPNTVEVSFSFNVDNTMNPSEVWLQVGDTSYNIKNHQLPLTLDVTGDELLNFENTSNQKILGFLNESVLSSIVSGWTNSNDDLANVVELSSALGVGDERLPSWTTNLANWVVSDEIHAADMIVAVEYIINQ